LIANWRHAPTNLAQLLSQCVESSTAINLQDATENKCICDRLADTLKKVRVAVGRAAAAADK